MQVPSNQTGESPLNNTSGNVALFQKLQEVAHARETGAEPLFILALGCGSGTDFDALSELGMVTGVDSDRALVEQKCLDYPPIHFVVADPCSLPFEGVFDVVFSDAVFHQVPDQIALLKNMATVLVDDGALVVEMGAQGNFALLQEGYTKAIRQHSGDYICQFCFPKESSYRRLLEITGFTVVDMEILEGIRPLPGGRDGLRIFAQQHFRKSLALYQSTVREQILADFERECEDDLWNSQEGCWITDFRHLRFTARKVRNVSIAGGASQLNVLGA